MQTMTLKKYLRLFGFISLLLFSCRSTKKTVDKVKTTLQETTTTKLQDKIQAETLTTERIKKTSQSVSIEARENEVTVREENGTLIITGADKIKIGGTESETDTRIQETVKQETNEEQKSKIKATSKDIKKDTTKKGVPTGAIIGGGFIALLLGVFVVYKKYPNFIGSIITLFRK